MGNQWSLIRTVDPTDEPVTVSNLRNQARIVIYDDDAVLFSYIKAARTWAEVYLNRQIMTATYLLTLDFFPSWTIKLPLPPLQSITSIKYLDTGGVQRTLSSALYLLDTRSAPGRLTPAYSQIWPDSRYQVNGIEITFVAGYASASAVPQTIKHAILLLAAHWYEHREDSEESRLQNIPMGAQALLDSERVVDFSGVLGSSNNVPGVVTAWGGNGLWN